MMRYVPSNVFAVLEIRTRVSRLQVRCSCVQTNTQDKHESPKNYPIPGYVVVYTALVLQFQHQNAKHYQGSNSNKT